jgi:hypothetical protein
MTYGAVGAGAAAAIAQAVKASGAIVRVEPNDFLTLVGKSKSPLVVTAQGGLFGKNYQYLTSYKGLAFFTKSSIALNLPGDAEIVQSAKIWMPG